MPLISQNMPRVIWRRLPVASTVALNSIRFRHVFSWPPSLSDLAQTLGFDQLKHLANQVKN